LWFSSSISMNEAMLTTPDFISAAIKSRKPSIAFAQADRGLGSPAFLHPR
jgi:hypothetical protein